MSKKAILVLNEMSENCRECQFEDQDDFRRRNICNATASDRVINDFGDEIDEEERPDWCPLKELPEREPDDQIGQEKLAEKEHLPVDWTQAFCIGWNACLNRIEGTEKGE